MSPYCAGNLSLHQAYVIRTAAFTGQGHGPFSAPLMFTMDPDTLVTTINMGPGTDMDMEELTSQTWFIAFIGSVLFVLVLLFILVIIYRRVRGPQKSLSHQAVPLHHRVNDNCHFQVCKYSLYKSGCDILTYSISRLTLAPVITLSGWLTHGSTH